ncbi:hypothetical protein L195_g024534 [Trifolium pratense]|uniref:Uncharacterized protein n=1 Tax=Trifolium pratense TaxID=57577 RepID=A0A2K3NDZ4_TRIPR|nr:hypothetical protein L195_g024534 [Trifolium pratense]
MNEAFYMKMLMNLINNLELWCKDCGEISSVMWSGKSGMIDAQSLITISVCDVLNTDGELNLSFLHDNLSANIVNGLFSN